MTFMTAPMFTVNQLADVVKPDIYIRECGAMDLKDVKRIAQEKLQHLSEQAQDMPGRAREWRKDLEDQGIIPSKVSVTPDGEIVPPFYVWWAPWLIRGVIVLIPVFLAFLAILIFGKDNDLVSSNGDLVAACGMGFGAPITIWLFRHRNSQILSILWVVAWAVILLFIVENILLIIPAIAVVGAMTYFEYIYACARYDRIVAGVYDDMRQALATYGELYMLEELREPDIHGESLTTIVDQETGRPSRAMIRHLPGVVTPGWLIAIDPARRFMTGISPDQRIRIKEILGDQ